jgi:hypothetical protein
VVDVDAGVLPLLLREGYSAAYGARPLKRTIERLVLLPLARVIAAGQARPGTALRLRARGGQVEVEVERPEPAAPAVSAPPPAPARLRQLGERVERLRDGTGPLSQRKAELLARSGQPGFWDDRPAAQALYDEVYRIDGVLSALEGLARAVGDLVEAGGGPDEALAALEGRSRHVELLLGCREARELGDALVVLTRVGGHGGLDGVGALARMYQRWAARCGLEVDVLGEHRDDCPAGEDGVILEVRGVGAVALLAGEDGLHQISRGRGERRTVRRGDEEAGPPPERDTVRVEVLPMPAGGERGLQVEVVPLESAAGRLVARPRLEVRLRHEPSLLTLRAWTDLPRSEAVARLGAVLHARLLAAEGAPERVTRPPVVRRYSLGPAPLVRDARSGRSTGRVDLVLQGHLDAFLALPEGGT